MLKWHLNVFVAIGLMVFWPVQDLGLVAGETRNVLPPVVNPECNGCSKPWLVHIKADGENDTLHHLWGVVGAPTFMMAVTNQTAKLKIDWEGFTNATEGSVKFDNDDDVLYSYGFSIANMILFNDVNDTGKIDGIPETDRVYIPMMNFTWEIKDVINSSVSEKGVVFETISFNGETLPNDTKVAIKVMAHGKDGRSTDTPPNLMYTPNAAQFDIILDNLILNVSKSEDPDYTLLMANFSSPRWAMNMVIFSMEDRSQTKEGFKYATRKSLDDEYAPGVFNVDEITTNLSRTSNKGGYMQWRPVCYLSPDRDVTNSTYLHVNTTFAELVELDDAMRKSLAYATFGDNLANRLVATETEVVFGQSKDNFYTAFKYTVWTLAYGVGSPPIEGFSTLVIVIISLGIGIPSLVFLVGGIFVGYRKHCSN